MGERKVLNKYFPPDFDPKKVPRMKRDPEKQINVRMMIPFSLQCKTCGEFMYRGKKFNSWKEDCIGEDYLGIRRFRFYIKCVICSQEITFKTDPENGDYELETGATRNFESWADKQATEKAHKEAREEEEKSDNMKQLENRTLDSKIELEIMDALDEIKAVNRRHETIDTADVLKASAARREKSAAGMVGDGVGNHSEDDAIIADIQFGGPKVRRLSESEDSSGSSDPIAERQDMNDLGENSKGKGKGKVNRSMANNLSETEGAHKVQSTPRIEMSSSGVGDVQGGGEEVSDPGVTRSTKAVTDTPGSFLVSGIEAQARREAARAQAAAGSTGTKIVVKHKKKRNKDRGAATAGRDKKRIKHKTKDKNSRGSSKTEKVEPVGPPGAEEVAPASTDDGAGGLGGLNLLGSYASSGSDGDAP